MTHRKKIFQRKRICRYCADPELSIDYKDVKALQYMISERGKIVPRRINGTCARHQRQVNEAVKRARHLAMIPYAGTSQS